MNQSYENFEELTKSEFKYWSRFYDSKLVRFFYFERIYTKITETLKSYISNLPPHSKFLDVACGTGEVIFRLAQEFPDIQFIGADFSEEMLEKTREKTARFKNVKVVQSNVRSLLFKDNSFDITLCSDAFHHFAEAERSLQEINRTTKTGGILFLVDPAFDTFIQKLIMSIFGKIVETPKKYYSKRELVLLLENAGFWIDHIYTYHVTNFFICRK